MTREQILALLREYEQKAEQLLAKTQIQMHYVVPRKGDAPIVLVVDDPNDGAEKVQAAALARHLADAHGADHVVMLSEVWVLKAADRAAFDRNVEEARRVGSVRHRADKREAVIVSVQLRDGRVAAAMRRFPWRKHMDTRPPEPGRPFEGPWEETLPGDPGTAAVERVAVFPAGGRQ